MCDQKACNGSVDNVGNNNDKRGPQERNIADAHQDKRQCGMHFIGHRADSTNDDRNPPAVDELNKQRDNVKVVGKQPTQIKPSFAVSHFLPE